MKILYSWLNEEYFDKKLPSVQDVSDALLFHSFEIEGIEEVGDRDWVIDVDVLPNRAHDCLSHRGIAKELSIILDIPLVQKDTVPILEEKETELSISLEEGVKCNRYIGKVIRGIAIKESPDWLKYRLEALGQRSINALVDATNYVLLSVGQPTHVFDLEKIPDKKINVRMTMEGEKITTLDNKEVFLETSDMVIASSNGPLALAGIKGGKNAEVTIDTTDVILESAHFDPVSVRKTSRRLAILTDSSKRFENEPTTELAEEAVKMLTTLVIKLCGNEDTIVETSVDVYPVHPVEKKVSVSLSYINDLLGTGIVDTELESIFKKFEWVYSHDSNGYVIDIPYERMDLNNSADIVEEVGRLYGYRNIESKILEKNVPVNSDSNFYYITLIRNILVENGFSEVYTSSFVSDGDLEVKNPVAQDRPFMRSTINLKDVFEMNIRNKDVLGVDEVKIFEIGKIFSGDGSEKLSLVLCTEKGVSEDVRNKLFSDVGIKVKEGTEVCVDDIEAQLSVIAQKNNYEGLFQKEMVPVEYVPFSVYPSVSRDIAVWVSEDTPQEELVDVIQKKAGDLLLREPKLVDTYPKDGRVSYAYRLIFQSYEKTLTDVEVSVLMEAIAKEVKDRGWEVR